MTSPDTFVRPADADDARAMGAIQVASWRLSHAGELGGDVVAGFDPEEFAGQWRDALARHGASHTHALLVACEADRVVGFAAQQPSPDPDAPEDGSAREITALFVNPEHWRRGHGSRLLAACVDVARRSGGTELRTWASDGDSARATFLQAAGFMPDGATRTLQITEERTMTERRLAASL